MLMAHTINTCARPSTQNADPRVVLRLQVVALDAPIEIRQAAAVNFKNYLKFNWVSEAPHSKYQCIFLCKAV